MLADTAAIRVHGIHHRAAAADLSAAAARFASVPRPACAEAFGPVAARYLAALARAAAGGSRAAAQLAEDLTAAAATAVSSARDYDAAERRAGALFGASGV